LFASEFRRNLGFLRIRLEGDAMQIVNAMKVKDRNHRSFGQLVDGIKGVLNARQF
jgi:hypothetical protein